MLGFLFGNRAGSIPTVYPGARPGIGTGSPTVFGGEVPVFTYKPEPVVYGEGELHDRPDDSKLPVNQWLSRGSSAIQGYMFQTYAGQRGIGSIWIRFIGGSKRYNYPNVPWIEFVNLNTVASQGRFVNHVLRPLYSVGRGRNFKIGAGRHLVSKVRP